MSRSWALFLPTPSMPRNPDCSFHLHCSFCCATMLLVRSLVLLYEGLLCHLFEISLLLCLVCNVVWIFTCGRCLDLFWARLQDLGVKPSVSISVVNFCSAILVFSVVDFVYLSPLHALASQVDYLFGFVLGCSHGVTRLLASTRQSPKGKPSFYASHFYFVFIRHWQPLLLMAARNFVATTSTPWLLCRLTQARLIPW